MYCMGQVLMHQPMKHAVSAGHVWLLLLSMLACLYMGAPTALPSHAACDLPWLQIVANGHQRLQPLLLPAAGVFSALW